VPSGWPSYPPSNRLFLQKVTRRGWRSYTTLQQGKNGGDEDIPLEFNLPSLSWSSFKGIQNLTHILHIYRKEKRPTIPKWFFEKKVYQSLQTDEVTRIDGTTHFQSWTSTVTELIIFTVGLGTVWLLIIFKVGLQYRSY
jgi:hypothetical protein